jgi:hypothetical protein
MSLFFLAISLMFQTTEYRKGWMLYLGLKSNLQKGLKWAVWITLAMALYFIISGIAINSELNLNI